IKEVFLTIADDEMLGYVTTEPFYISVMKDQDGLINMNLSPAITLNHYKDVNEFINKMGEISVFFALDRIPMEAIKTCQECGRYFLHLTKKPKYYCNPKCTSRAMGRKRKEDKEKYGKYLEQQKRIMKKKYREKKAKEQGKSVDKVKIQKRSAPKKKSKKKEG
ncbi:hypothetical protein ACFL4G_12160, partial [Thermodesulfobacteriota bacterium]